MHMARRVTTTFSLLMILHVAVGMAVTSFRMAVYDPHRGSDLLSYEGGILLASHDTKKPKQKGRVLDKRVSCNSH